MMEFQLSYFKSWKVMLWKCCTQYASKFGNLSSNHRTGTGRFSFQFQRKDAKECSNYCTIALISHASKVMLKILQARPKQYANRELPDVEAGFRKGRGIRYQIANLHWINKKATEFQKNIYFCFIDYAKAFDCVNHNKLWKILQETGIQTTLLTTSWENCMQVKKKQNQTWNNRLVPNWERSMLRLYIVTLLI